MTIDRQTWFNAAQASAQETVSVLLALATLELGLTHAARPWFFYPTATLVWSVFCFASRLVKTGETNARKGQGVPGFDHVIATAIFAGALFAEGVAMGWLELGAFAVLGWLAIIVGSAGTGSLKDFDRGSVVWDAIMAWIAFFSLPRLAFTSGALAAAQAGLFAVGLISVGLGFKIYRTPTPSARARWLSRATFLVGVIGVAFAGSKLFEPGKIIWSDVACLTFMVIREWTRFRPKAHPLLPGEDLRRALLLLTACFVVAPYFSSTLVGSGDAKLYAEAMTDFLAQLKAGIVPPLVSQSEVAPFGSPFPFRMEWYHFYLGAGINLLTFGKLSLSAVQNSTIIVSAIGGVFSMYWALNRLGRLPRVFTALLAAVYGLSPGWIGPLYAKDMFFTFMAMPIMPLVMLATHRTVTRKTASSSIALGATLAAVWLIHPPVGLWASIAVALLQILSPPRFDSWLSWLRNTALTWIVCLGLGAGLFISLNELRDSGTKVDPTDVVMQGIHSMFPAILLPAAANPNSLGDMQPGYALLGLLLVAVLSAAICRERLASRWLIVATLLLVLIIPVPGLTHALWKITPWNIITISNIWPVQRIVPILAALGIFAVAISVSPLHERLGVWARRTTLAALAGLLAWSGLEASKYVKRGFSMVRSVAENQQTRLSENSPFLINWAAYLPSLPPSHAVEDGHDPRLLNRLLERESFRPVLSNFDVVRSSARNVPEVLANADPLHAAVWRVSPPLILEPAKRYLLAIKSSPATVGGLLQLHGPAFFRQISRVGGPVGTTMETPLWTSLPTSQTLLLDYVPGVSSLAALPVSGLFSYQLIPYTPANLPILIESFAPYVARMESAKPVWLETHRFFLPGYRAAVNGKTVPVVRSPTGLAMVEIPAGKSRVQLDYVGTAWLRLGIYLSLTGWLALAGAGLWFWRRNRSRLVHTILS